MPLEPRFEHGFIEALFETARFGLGLIDSDLRYVRVNEVLAQSNGLSAEDHEGRSVREVIPGLADMAEPLLREVIATGQPVVDLQLSGPTPADPDADRDFLVTYYPVADDHGVIGVGAVVVEVTEGAKARRELAEQAREIYENVVQDLAVVALAHEAGDIPRASAATQRALRSARHIASKVLLEGGPDDD